jgi:hypothetical protein
MAIKSLKNTFLEIPQPPDQLERQFLHRWIAGSQSDKKRTLFEDDKPFPLHVNHSQSCQGQHRTSLPHDATLLFKVADHVMSGHCFATLSTQLLSIGTNSEALEFLGVKILCIMCQGRPEAKCPPHSTFNLTLKYWS